MGYDKNNDYYSNDDQSWRDQTNVYQTQREQPTPMGSRRPRRRSGWLKGILAVLLVVAISFGAFYLMRNVGVRLERTEDGVTLSMTNRSKQAEPEQAEQPIPELDDLADISRRSNSCAPCYMEANYEVYNATGSGVTYKLSCPTAWFDLCGWAAKGRR